MEGAGSSLLRDKDAQAQASLLTAIRGRPALAQLQADVLGSWGGAGLAWTDRTFSTPPGADGRSAAHRHRRSGQASRSVLRACRGGLVGPPAAAAPRLP
jgi:hypothetical protein